MTAAMDLLTATADRTVEVDEEQPDEVYMDEDTRHAAHVAAKKSAGSCRLRDETTIGKIYRDTRSL